MTQYDAIWEAIKDWDIERKPGEGLAHATGTDVVTIMNALKEADAAVSDLVSNDPKADTPATQSRPVDNELEAKLRDFIKDHRYDNVQEMVTALTALLHTHQQALLDRVLAQGVQAERISYLPEAYDMTRNWPIIQQPCYILPVAVIQQAIKELQ